MIANQIPDRKEFSVIRAAELLNCTPPTIYRWVRDGFLRAERRPKNHVVIPRESIMDILRKSPRS